MADWMKLYFLITLIWFQPQCNDSKNYQTDSKFMSLEKSGPKKSQTTLEREQKQWLADAEVS